MCHSPLMCPHWVTDVLRYCSPQLLRQMMRIWVVENLDNDILLQVAFSIHPSVPYNIATF